MILNEGMRYPDVTQIEIVRSDDHTKKLSKVIRFDTETKEAEIYVSLVHEDKSSIVACKRDDFSTENNLSILDKGFHQEVVKANVTLLGYVAVDKRTGKVIE